MHKSDFFSFSFFPQSLTLYFSFPIPISIFVIVVVSDITRTTADNNNRVESNMSLHPYFDFDVPRNVTARVGQTAFLRCRVEQLGDKSVSFSRRFYYVGQKCS